MRKSKKHTMIRVRRILTDPKTALAGVILEIFSARLKALIAAFNAETAPWRSLDRWDLASIVEIRGSCERTV